MTKSNKYTWLHIGLGSFHRAHQAWYLHKLIESGDDSWSISAGNIRNDAEDIAGHLANQDGKYMLETISPKGDSAYEEITSIQKIIPWQADLAPLIAEGMKESTKVIAFTVTEAGYYLDTSFKLDQENSAVAADLAGDNQTIYGTVAKILRERMKAENGPVTLLNCDNVRHNGERFHDGLMEFLALSGDSELLAWLESNATCPNTMVDRITPRPSAELPARIEMKTGIADKAPVMGEEFIQWVVEDKFITIRPNLETVGVETVDSVIPYEEAKIRILNASHSCIAWAGTLANQSYIHESTLTDSIFKVAYDYVTEDVIPSLGNNGIDLPTYRDVVLERFTNPYIQDTNQRVAADGFSKIPAMVTPTMIDCYNRNETPDATAALPALFFTFMQKWHEGQLPYEYQDGILDEQAVHAMYNSADPIKAYATNEMLFGELASKPEFETLLRNKIAVVSPMFS
ncbi:D-arabinitol 4-dehydrogenase [Psychromonas aquimarina]|uniref:D-arabinitol 4-dehydrogenase n=1 Tax=Psychromonas aquimarina TaxID=444919 RepID=UPI000425433E|nr:D-arabinitol 4-dehydrogenase [Psychromonas aquimarina]